MVDQDAVQLLPHPEDLPGLDVDVGGLPLHAAQRLVDQDPGVGEREALAFGPGRQQQGGHGSRLLS